MRNAIRTPQPVGQLVDDHPQQLPPQVLIVDGRSTASRAGTSTGISATGRPAQRHDCDAPRSQFKLHHPDVDTVRWLACEGRRQCRRTQEIRFSAATDQDQWPPPPHPVRLRGAASLVAVESATTPRRPPRPTCTAPALSRRSTPRGLRRSCHARWPGEPTDSRPEQSRARLSRCCPGGFALGRTRAGRCRSETRKVSGSTTDGWASSKYASPIAERHPVNGTALQPGSRRRSTSSPQVDRLAGRCRRSEPPARRPGWTATRGRDARALCESWRPCRWNSLGPG